MCNTDLIVIGGGLAGCMAAIRAADAGLSVVLAEKREYPGREIAAFNHTFVDLEGEERFNRECPQWLTRLFSMRDDQEAMAPDGLTRQWLIEALEASGVTVLYSAIAVGLTQDEDGVTGVLLATPLGVMHLAANKVVDATERHNLCRIADGKPYLSGTVRVDAVFEMENMQGLPTGLEAVEGKLSLIGGSLRVHPTLRKDTTAIEFSYMEEAGRPFVARSELETRRIARSGEVAAALREHIPCFANASLSHHAYDALLSGEPIDPPEITGLMAAPSLRWRFSLGDVAQSWEQAGAVASWVCESAAFRCGVERLRIGGAVLPFDRTMLAPYADDGLKVELSRFDVSTIQHQLMTFDNDICVVGSGSGGGMAMLAAAESGKSVAVIEVNTLMGGTHTVGRVTGYYDGYRSGMNNSVGEKAKAFAQTTGKHEGHGGIPHASYLNDRVVQLGVQVFTASFACGALMEGMRVTGVVAANEDGLFGIRAHVTIDATGHADMAAFAGGAYEIGDPETGMVQSYSMWGAEVYPAPLHVMHRFLRDPGICHPDLYSERLRAVRDGHLGNSSFHISPMVTVRESRRIVGEHYLTVRDLLDDQVHDDVIAVACSRADSHAYTSSPLARMGGLGAGKEIKVRIPYRCYIPKGIQGLLVAAKALSGERDATSFCRMNADVKNAGYAIGLAAAMAVDNRSDVRNIDLPALQSTLKTLGILPDWAFAESGLSDIDQLANKCSVSEEEAFIALLRRPDHDALPVLERLYNEGKRGYVAHALAWFGSDLGGEQLATLLNAAIDEGRHRVLPYLNMNFGLFREGRHYGDDYTLVNRLIVLAGRSKHEATIEPLARLIADTEGFGPQHPGIAPYYTLREDIPRHPFFYRMLNIAYAAAEKADQRLAPAMDRLLSRPGVTGYATELHSAGHPQFMLAHAEISLARAAVRCGSAVGLTVLAAYLNDTHSFFRQTARRELGFALRQEEGTAK
ncbi:putative FAD-binding dehydrogenase [Paenibacillus konkukensis]|uniref:FAD-binding dehydrogenase n=1 Tax=Paenibacillus konkukensis TaxID=2020716 RepID=A0ABY4S2Y7_9BACL|nr:FAD-dependent oxidoreductase [Paenibacillus konkukensis]UQZ87539.1 putative FAD-binding dehydrogenase [Paenibacillus konkukensis]